MCFQWDVLGVKLPCRALCVCVCVCVHEYAYICVCMREKIIYERTKYTKCTSRLHHMSCEWKYVLPASLQPTDTRSDNH